MHLRELCQYNYNLYNELLRCLDYDMVFVRHGVPISSLPTVLEGLAFIFNEIDNTLRDGTRLEKLAHLLSLLKKVLYQFQPDNYGLWKLIQYNTRTSSSQSNKPRIRVSRIRYS